MLEVDVSEEAKSVIKIALQQRTLHCKLLP